MQIFKTLCDRHWSLKGEEVEAEHTGVPLKLGRKEGESDLCGHCMDEIAELLAPWFEIGRRPGKSTAPVAAPTRPKAKAEERAESSPNVHRKGKQEADANGMYHCRWSDGDDFCDDQRDNAQGRSMHERKAHDFYFNQLTEEEQADAIARLEERLLAVAS